MKHCRMRSTSVFVVTVVLCVAPILAQVSEAPPSSPETATERARAYVRGLIEKNKTPGMSVAVAVDGHIVWSEAFGEADLENHVPVRPETKFRLGSVSKLLTVTALMRLYEEGTVDLDAPVQRYVPYFPEKEYPITLRQLAGHTAGIRHYRDGDPFVRGPHYSTVREALELFRNDPLLFEPGTQYAYSSYGYNLISAAIEGASGKPFLDYMREAVLAPLGMKGTVADDPFAIVPGRTRFYTVMKDGRIENAPYVDSSFRWASGGLLSTAEDLARFGSVCLKPGFFKGETLSLMLTPQRLKSGKQTNVGMGWRIGNHKDGGRFFHHGGTIEGGRAFLFVDERTHTVVALLANSVSDFGEEEADAIVGFFAK